ncbi:hypothetical protein CEP52_006792 [Fusarium oligoseptatum]|uniref:Amino acid permease/ SLC12A domain-containing protein n=1 Tax=Fusarium oligoseptatum TaxID=2604345 RepID=A0A428TRF1_9HYPO|nr:hypothetical protein CEP52_006792 [Fusarium oligoseptatum]
MATKQDDMALDVDHPGTPDGRASTDGQHTSSAEVQIDLKRGFKMRHVNMFAIAGSILNVSTSSSTVFGYFVSLSTVLGLINWVNIIVTYFCFQRGIKAQGITRAGLPWKGPLQPYSVYFTFVVTATIIIFSGYSAFIHGFKLAKFITSYLGIVVYLLNIFAFKVWRRTSRVKALDMDLVQGRGLYDEDVQEEKPNRNFVQRLTGALWGS